MSDVIVTYETPSPTVVVLDEPAGVIVVSERGEQGVPGDAGLTQAQVDARVALETDRAEGIEAGIQDALDAEIATRQADIDAEIAVRQALADDLAVEVTDRSNAIAAEAALARNADNLASGTVADERIASTIARDAEVAALIAQEVTDRNTAIASAVVGLADYRGVYNASVNTFPAAGGSGTAGAVVKADFWVASVAGTLGGVAVTAGDLIIAKVDTPGQTAGNWDLVNHEIGYAPEDSANKDTDDTFAANSDTKYPSQKAAKTYVDAAKAAAIAASDPVGAAAAAQAYAVQRGNHTGTQSADTVVDGTTNKAYTAAEKTKLAGVATGATANDTDANLKARANHTGTQPLSTISDAGSAAALAADTDGTLAANSDTRLATQKAVKTYADQLIASADAMVFKGVIDASANPNYPAADKGWTYRISVAGKIGGASGTNVEVGDLILCLADGTAAGTQAAVGSSWSIAQTNIDGAVVGPASAVNSQLAAFDGTSGKLIKDSGLAVDVDGTLAANSDAKLASQKAVKTYADTKVAKSLFDAETILVAVTDDTPIALTVPASTVVGRKATGDIAALTVAELKTLLGLGTTVVNATNASAYTVPAGVTLLEVIAVGGGGQGGGGGSNVLGAVQAGAGGGGAGANVRSFMTVAPGDVISVTIGAGGSAAGVKGAAGGNGGTQGSAGGSTTVTNGTWTVTAKGGQGGFPSGASTNTQGSGGFMGGQDVAANVGGNGATGLPGTGGTGSSSATQRPGGAPIGPSGGGGGGGGQSNATNGGLGGGAGTAYAGGAGVGSGGAGTAAGTDGAAAAANTGAGGGGGGGGTNGTGAGGNGGAGGSGYVVLRPVN